MSTFVTRTDEHDNIFFIHRHLPTHSKHSTNRIDTGFNDQMGDTRKVVDSFNAVEI